MCAQGISNVLRELSSQLGSLTDYVRQLYGSVLVKLAARKMNHATLVAGTLLQPPCHTRATALAHASVAQRE